MTAPHLDDETVWEANEKDADAQQRFLVQLLVDDPDGVDGVTIAARRGSGGGYGVVNPHHSI